MSYTWEEHGKLGTENLRSPFKLESYFWNKQLRTCVINLPARSEEKKLMTFNDTYVPLEANRKHVAYRLFGINTSLHNSALFFNHIRPFFSSLQLSPPRSLLNRVSSMIWESWKGLKRRRHKVTPWLIVDSRICHPADVSGSCTGCNTCIPQWILRIYWGDYLKKKKKRQ